jgi:hypothetical protein
MIPLEPGDVFYDDHTLLRGENYVLCAHCGRVETLPPWAGMFPQEQQRKRLVAMQRFSLLHTICKQRYATQAEKEFEFIHQTLDRHDRGELTEGQLTFLFESRDIDPEKVGRIAEARRTSGVLGLLFKILFYVIVMIVIFWIINWLRGTE